MTRRPVLVVAVWTVLLVVGLVGAFTGFGERGLFQRLQAENGAVPGTQSAQVYDLTQGAASDGEKITMVVRGVQLADATQGAVAQTQMEAERTRLQSLPHVDSVLDPFAFPPQDPRGQAFLSSAGTGFVAVVTLAPHLSDADAKQAHQDVVDEIGHFSTSLGEHVSGASALPLSTKEITASINAQVEKDLIRGEAIGLPIALLLMVLVFGGLIAAGLPLWGAGTSIVLGMFALWGLTHVMGIDSFILNVISIIGLALSIDYGLLMVSRFREEAHRHLTELGHPGDGTQLPSRDRQRTLVLGSVARAVETSGRTVTFSALTIACAILGLLVMRSPILRTIGLGGIIVVLLAVATAITLVPAVLALLGHKLLAPSPLTKVPGLRQLFARASDVASDSGVFSRLAAWVHRHPWAVMLTVAAALVTMCLPFGTMSLRNDFEEYIPKDSDTYVAYQDVNQHYPALATPSITVVADRTVEQSGPLVEHLKGLAHVTYVSQPTAVSDADHRVVVNVRVDTDDPVGPRVTDLVTQLRDWHPGYDVLVGGGAAQQMDFNHSLAERAPIAVGIMALAVLVLMFLMTGSFIVPLKALVINMLSLVASLGATWWLFEQGWLGLPKLHGMTTFVVAVALSFGFGLAMDYEVFLLARIKEYWDKGFSNDKAVELGLQRSGRIITSAAAIIVAVFLGFVAGDMLAIKQIGVALAVVVITDATLVRMLLVPATMTLLGKWNWWSPRWMQAIYERFKIIH